MKALSLVVKIIFGLGLTLLILGGIFAAFNWTLVKNMRGWQEGGFDAYYTERQHPRQIIKGATSPKNIPLANLPNDQFLETLENWENTGGKALLIWHDGVLVLEKYADGISPTDLSKSFSLHKSVLGLVASMMEADEIFDLDEPLSTHLPTLGDRAVAALSLRDMLTHQSGLERFPMSPPSLKSLNLLLGGKIERTALSADIADDNPVFDYSNVNYQIAGAFMRKALKDKTGQTYAEYVSERLWKKIGASDAYLWSETQTGAPRFYAGLLTGAQDWLKLGIMIALSEVSTYCSEFGLG